MWIGDVSCGKRRKVDREENALMHVSVELDWNMATPMMTECSHVNADID